MVRSSLRFDVSLTPLDALFSAGLSTLSDAVVVFATRTEEQTG
jgi:hypothetical protein